VEEEDETLETTAILVRARERNSVMRNTELVGSAKIGIFKFFKFNFMKQGDTLVPFREKSLNSAKIYLKNLY